VLVTRVLEVGEAGPVTALQAFLAGLMQATGMSRMLAPVVVEDGVVSAEVIAGGERMARVNPLLPLMRADAVAALRTSREGAPAEAMLAVLRPCEVRTAVELAKQGKLDLSNTVLVGIDCLSTFELAYWERGKVLHRGSPDWLVDEALQLAQAGQVQAEGTRLFCQLCDRPAADYRAADLLIGLVGVQNQERLLVLADEAKDARWKLQGLTDRPATERETADREVALWRLADRRKEAAAACLQSLGLVGSHPAAIMRHMSKCTLCGDCIEVCPRWSEELRAALTRGREAFIQALLDAARGLAGCAECGICQVECSEGIPLSVIQRAFGLQAQNRMHSAASGDSRDPLPWTT
jgi:formate dehydrogenase subunit beta